MVRSQASTPAGCHQRAGGVRYGARVSLLLPALVLASSASHGVRPVGAGNLAVQASAGGRLVQICDTPVHLPEVMDFVAEDDLTLYGLWAWQEDRADAPILLYSHGNAANIGHYTARVDLYGSWGWNVCAYDYRGFDRSEGTPEHDGVIADGRAAARTAAAALNREVGDLAYLGESLEGFVSVHAAGDEVPCALATEDMFASAEALMALNTGLDLPAGWLFEEPYDNERAAAERGDVPMLVVHGELDDYVPLEHGERVMAAAAEPKTCWGLPGSDHAQAPWTQPELYEQTVRTFIEDSCGWGG